MQENDIITNSAFLYNMIFIRYSEAGYFRNREGVHLLAEIKAYSKENFFVDFYCGTGIYRKYGAYTSFINASFTNDYMSDFYDDLYYGYLPLGLHLTANFKVGWRF